MMRAFTTVVGALTVAARIHGSVSFTAEGMNAARAATPPRSRT